MDAVHRARTCAAWLLALGCLIAPAQAQQPAKTGLPATLPLRRDAPSDPASSPWLAASGALLALAAGGTVLVGRRRRWPWLRLPGMQEPQRELQRLSSTALTAQASLHAVRWKGEVLLLACTAQQITLLARRPDEVTQGEAS